MNSIQKLLSKLSFTATLGMILFGITALVYSRSMMIPFHFDDSHAIESNVAMRSLSFLPKIWSDPTTSSIIPENQAYRPLTFTGYCIAWVLGGGSVFVFHVFKVLMHFGTALFLFLIWRELFRKKGWWPTQKIPPDVAAFIPALIFAVHPACVESAAYISATSSLQCSFFYVAAVYVFLKTRERQTIKSILTIVALFAASVMSKQEGITLPAVLFLTTFFLTEGGFDKRLKKSLIESAPYWLAALVLGFIVIQMEPDTNAKSRGNVAPMDYFMTQWRAYLWYMRIWFWPWDLNADNLVFGFSTSFWDDARVIQALIGNLALLSFAYWRRKDFPALLYGLLWYYITIAPASSVVPLAEPVNEHRMYLSYVGFAGGVFVVLAWLFLEALKPALSFRASKVVLGMIFMGLVIGTEVRITVWQNSRNLWEDTVEKNPESGRALNNLALIYMQSREYPKAIDMLSRCEQHWPSYLYCPLNKAVTYMAMHDVPNAETNILRAYSLDTQSTYTNFFMGKFYEEMKSDHDKAISYFQKADSLSGDRNIEAKYNIGVIYVRTGRLTEAKGVLDQIQGLEPNGQFAQILNTEIQKAQMPKAITLQHS